MINDFLSLFRLNKEQPLKVYDDPEVINIALEDIEFKQNIDTSKKEDFSNKPLEYFLGISFYLDIYPELMTDYRWKNTFIPVDFFNLLHQKLTLAFEYKEEPIKVIDDLESLNLSEQQHYCLYHFLGDLLTIIFKQLSEISNKDYETFPIIDMIKVEYDKLDNKLNSEAYKYDFEKVKTHLQTLNTHYEKITYLIEQKALYQQDDNKPKNVPSPNFESKCTIEIEKLETLSKIEEKHGNHLSQNTDSELKLSSKLSKIDFIRILNVMYEMRMFETIDEQIPTKVDFMNIIGDHFNINLSDYSRNLSQSLQNQAPEINTRVFRNMIAFIEKEICTNK